MNIRDIQIKKCIDGAVERILKQGIIPTIRMARNIFNDAFRLQVPGYPKFKPTMITRNSLSDPAIHNRMIDLIVDDIEDLYDTNTAYYNELLALFGLYTTEHEHNATKIADIQNRVYMLLQNKLYNNISYAIHDNFNDFLKIDFTGDQEFGIARTNSHVCLRSHSVMNGITTKDSKISISEAEALIEVPENVVSSEMISPVQNALKDTLNESWIQLVKTENADGLVIRLSVEMRGEYDVTDIEFDLCATRPLFVKLHVFDINKAQKTLKTVETTGIARWNFKKTKIKAFTFEITKQEADGVNEGLRYEYYIGAKNISVYNNIYQDKTSLVSVPFEPKNPFTYANLDVRHVLPPGTYISYYIGIGYLYKDTHWLKCGNKQTIDLGLLTEIKRYINNKTPRYAENYIDNLYTLAVLRHDHVVESMIELYIGDNMWERKKLFDITEIEYALEQVYNSNDIDYIGLDRVEAENISVEGGSDAEIEWQPPNSAYLYTTNVFCNEAGTIRAAITNQQDFRIHKTYVNGFEIEIEPDTIPMRLNSGWNTIQIAVVTGDERARMYCNVFFYDAAETVRAVKEKIKYVSYKYMRDNVHKTAHKYYTILDNRILLNYNPKSLNMTAYLKYMYMRDPDIFNNIQVRLMAVLESKNSDITPILKEYNILLM